MSFTKLVRAATTEMTIDKFKTFCQKLQEAADVVNIDFLNEEIMVAMLLKPEALPTELFSGSDEEFKEEYGFGATELQAIKIDQALNTGLIRNLIAHDLVLTDQADFYVSGVEQKTLGNSPHWKTGYIEVKKQKIPINQVIDVLLYLK